MMIKLVWLLLIATVAFAGYVRFAPYDAARWHVASSRNAIGDYSGMNTFEAVRGMSAAPVDILRALETVILNDPRTQMMSGQVEDGIVTYQTRSRLFGYPDYTTVSVIDTQAGPLLSIHGRARFGKSDINQNAKRIKRWIAAAGPLLVGE